MTNQKPPAILQLEQELNVELKEVTLSEIKDWFVSFGDHFVPQPCFSQNEQREVVGLRYIRLKLSDLSLLQHLTQLTQLNLWQNKIKDLNPLQHLVKLTQLDLGGNHGISDLSPLQHLTQLTQLYLLNNQISDLSPLQHLTQLTRLDLRSNKISQITLDFLNCFPELTTLQLDGNPIQNIPREIFDKQKTNVLPEVRHYLEGVAKASSQVYQAKIILIGNGRVGKTCLVKRWLDNTFNPAEPSTHAIQLRHHELETLARAKKFTNIQLNIWDFGGQDIYHATHRLFMKTHAWFILVWDAQTEAEAELNYRNYPLRYWLDYTKYLGDNSPVLIVQTKRDRDGKRGIEQWEELHKNYNLIDFLTVESSKEKRNGFQEFTDCLEEQIEKILESSYTALPTAWWQVQQQIQELKERSEKMISVAQFEQYCEKSKLNRAQARTLLQYSHDIGLLFYPENLFQNQIILDQKWAIEAVYTLFDRNGLFPRLIHAGEFSRQDLQYVWQTFSQAEQELFLSFMKSCEICFEIDWDIKPFEKRRLLAPALLPDEKPVGLVTWQHVESKWFVRYQYRFLHYGNLQSFLGRTHHLATDLWKNGCQLEDKHGNLALVEGFFAREAQYLQVCVTGENPQVLLDRIRNELEEIQQDDHVTELLSLDGQHFVEREQLALHPKENPHIQAEDGVWLQYNDFQHFLQKNPHEVFMPAKKVIKIFVSYAHEDSSLRELLVKGLTKHLKHREIEYLFWTDKDIRLGKEWRAEIEQSLENTEVALLLVSANFAASDFINTDELPEFFKRKQSDGYLIIPVLVREYNFEHFEKLSALNFFCPKYGDYGFTDLRKLPR
jgi:GTPase SAR1 family protein